MSPPRPVPIQPKPPTPPPASPELQAVELAYREAGYALRRAEAALAKAKQEQGPDSAAAKAAQQKVVEANAAHEKAQRALKEKLGLVSKRSPAPTPRAVPKPPVEKKVADKYPPESAKKTFVVLEEARVLKVRETEILHGERLRQILEEIKKDPKNGVLLMKVMEAPRGEMLIRQTKVFRKPAEVHPKPEKKKDK